LVVTAAPERDVLRRRRAPERVGVEVVVFEESALAAALSVRSHEPALPIVPPPGHAPGLVRGVPRSVLIRPGTDRPRPGRRAGLRPLDLLEEQRDRAIEDGGRIAVRDLATEQRLKPPQLVVRFLADRELDAIALRKRRCGNEDMTKRTPRLEMRVQMNERTKK